MFYQGHELKSAVWAFDKVHQKKLLVGLFSTEEIGRTYVDNVAKYVNPDLLDFSEEPVTE